MVKLIASILIISFFTACTTPVPQVPGISAVSPANTAPQWTTVSLKNPSFEPNAKGQIADWTPVEHGEGNSYTFVADPVSPLSGPTSARLHRHGVEFFGLLNQKVRVNSEWVGKTARFYGYLKTENIDGKGGALILQATGGGGEILAWNHMNDSRVKGTQHWKPYFVEIKIPKNAFYLLVGTLLEDSGTLWIDDVKLEIVD